jgi:hypothetical protein
VAFLKILGITVPIASSVHNVDVIGDRAEVLMTDRDRFSDVGDSWQIDTDILSGDDAESLEGLLDGRGHVWPFDADTWSKAGLPPNAIVGTITAGGKWGSYLDTTAVVPTYPVDFVGTGLPYTAFGWLWNGASFDHKIIRDDGARWLNGVRNDATANPYTFGTSSFALSTNARHDDVAIVPCRVSTSHAPLLYAFANAQALPAFRKITVEGDFYEGGAQRTARAFNVARTAAPSSPSGTWDPRAARLSFQLVEAKA